MAEDRDSYGSNCEPNATAPRLTHLGSGIRGSRAASATSKRVRDRGAVDVIAVGRARRVQRAAARPAEPPACGIPTAERSHCPSQCAPVATQSTLCPGKEASLFWPKIEIRTVRTANPMRPLRGRRIWVPGSAGRALARCARPRATHGYCIDRSAVADHPASRGAKAVKRRRTSTSARDASRGTVVGRPPTRTKPAAFRVRGPFLSAGAFRVRGPFLSAVGAKAPEPTAQAVGIVAEFAQAPEGRKKNTNARRPWPTFAPCGAKIDLCLLTHGLRRGLRCFRAYGA